MEISAFPGFSKILNPREIRELGFTKDFSQQESQINVDFTELTLVNEDREMIYDWIYSGQGRFENIPARIRSQSGHLYEYYLNLQGMSFSDEEVTVGIGSRKGTTHFFDNAKGLTFELLRQKGFLPDSLMVNVPYLIQQENVQMQAIIILSTTITLTISLVDLIKATGDLVGDALDVVGTGLLTAIAKAIVYAIWLVFTVLSILILAKQLKELLFPKLRNFKAISDYNLIKKGIEYLGFTLQSSFMESIKHIHTLPIPEQQPGKSRFDFLDSESAGVFYNSGYPKAGDTTPDLWSLIDHYLKGYNQKILVNNGVVRIDSDSVLQSTANVFVKTTLSNQEKRVNEWTYNDDEVYGRKYIHWVVDESDTHSPDQAYRQIRAEYITVPIQVLNADLVNVTNLDEIPLNFAWLARKNSLTKPEKIAANLLGFIDKVVNKFGGSSNLSGAIDQRLGVGMISSQYFSVTKKISLYNGNNRQGPNFFNELSADAIYLDFHAINEVNQNCRKIFEMTVPFTDANFTDLLLNYYVNLEDGTQAKVLKINWKDRKHKATMTVSVPDGSGFNVKSQKLA